MSLVDEVKPEMTSGGSSFEAVPASSGQSKVDLAAMVPTSPPESFLVHAGELALAQIRANPSLTALGAIPVSEVHGAPLVNYVDKARRRIAALRDAPAPWADDDATSPTLADATTQAVVVAPDAESAAIAVFSYFLMSTPPSAVAIFPKEDGGLRLQTVGEERTLVVDISPDAREFVGEYAGDDVFHTETFRSTTDAAQFIIFESR